MHSCSLRADDLNVLMQAIIVPIIVVMLAALLTAFLVSTTVNNSFAQTCADG